MLFANDAINLVPVWKNASTIIIHNYLQKTLTHPIAKFTADYTSSRLDGKNCCFSECSYTQIEVHSVSMP